MDDGGSSGVGTHGAVCVGGSRFHWPDPRPGDPGGQPRLRRHAASCGGCHPDRHGRRPRRAAGAATRLRRMDDGLGNRHRQGRRGGDRGAELHASRYRDRGGVAGQAHPVREAGRPYRDRGRRDRRGGRCGRCHQRRRLHLHACADGASRHRHRAIGPDRAAGELPRLARRGLPGRSRCTVLLAA